MLDLLLIPAATLLVLALRAVHEGDHRRHGQLMTAVIGCLALRLFLAFPGLPSSARPVVVGLLILLGITALLGRGALAWREGSLRFARVPRFHRTAGALSLVCLALGLTAWVLMRWR